MESVEVTSVLKAEIQRGNGGLFAGFEVDISSITAAKSKNARQNVSKFKCLKICAMMSIWKYQVP